nr:hypothetical protein [Tanacetum cinerariifolium]
MDNKKHIVNLESFRDMLHICPRVHGQSFVEPPFEEEILVFIHFLRHSAAIKTLTDVNINKLYQPRRSFAAIINKGLPGKSSGYDSLRLSQAQILRNKVNWHYVKDDHMFSIIKLVSRHQNTQQFGALLTIELTNEEIRNSNAYKEYYAIATGAAPPKPKASAYKEYYACAMGEAAPKPKASARKKKGDSASSTTPPTPTPTTTEELSWNSFDDEDVSGHEEGNKSDESDDECDEGSDDDSEETVKAGAGKDTHVTLTPVNPDGPQESSSMSSFVSSMLNPTCDVGVESIFTTASSPIVSLQTPTPIMTPSTIATITTSSEAPIPPPIIPNIILKNLPTFNSAFRFKERLRTLYAIAADLSKMELKKILIEKMEGNKSIQRSDEQRNLYKALVEAYEADKAILDTYGDSTILKRRREDDDQEGPSAGSNRGSKRQKEGGEQASASTLSKKATEGAGRSTTGPQSRQMSAKEGGDDEQEYDEETRDEESFDPISKTPKNSDDEGNGEEDLYLNVGREGGHVEEEEEDELYRDVNINQGRGIQTTLEVEDSHVTLTLINPDGQQQSSSVSSQFVTSMLNPTLDVVSAIRRIVKRYMDQRMNEAVKMAVQIQSDHLCDEAQRENDKFLKTIDENMQKIIKEQVKEQVKALVEAYESDKIILDTYEDTVTLKRRRDDDADKDEEPSAGPDRGSKRRREGKEPESVNTPKEKATRSAGKLTQGTKSRQASASESAIAEEPMQTTFQMEVPSHPEFDTGAEDQPIVQSSQYPKWFSQQQKPPSPNRDWNKTMPATHESIQPWISELAKLSYSRSSFNELMDTPLDFSNFLINRLKVDTLTPKLLVGPTYELMKGSCKSLVELKYHLEEVFKATTDQLDWVNPKGQQYPHNLLKPLLLIPNNRGRRVIPFEHFINNDLEYLRGGASSRKYTTSITKTKAADYGHIKWIKDLVSRTMWIKEPI